MNKKRIFKYFLQALLLIGVGAAVFFGIGYYGYYNSPEYQAEQEVESLTRQYMEDTYGGETPEETLELFISALEKGDVELASKYFVLDKQEEIHGYLAELRDSNGLKNAIVDAHTLKLTKNNGDRVFFTIADENNIVEVQLVMIRGLNGKWKILEL
ncbi:MAG: hypothetical protein A2934_05600 [Candidatus Sungbacteria bacterium RIFCSPLOWO2_01_FULL_47_10]|uniref:Uncharacterized protein n=1 Tax=Candidatus Sungbacteria bacterium RIFCSPLOWO2_01_FULL_47_10 TaxID=1802276 RepID=A0A1G2L713_9BACT|nr:MAG: hypothetical protein A2934_05600 [Candidatus Sungbacteria bacterium RIFCSPLOWO2_01_FULL_47_10]